ncbi:unnamed protein product, partial [marine sediment metagenome]
MRAVNAIATVINTTKKNHARIINLAFILVNIKNNKVAIRI